ncbi:MAG: glycosyltransferase family 9 protein [Chitinophagaceae bacterium]
MKQTPPRILLGMLVANGDCLMATVLARQIKTDFPGCHLTWAISDRCRQVIEENPDVDTIWEIPLPDKKAGEGDAWHRFVAEAEKRKTQGEFDKIFYTQIYPSNVYRFDGTTRGTIYNAYPHPVTVNARPVLRLREEEKEKVKAFAETHHLSRYSQVLIFECSAFSGQSFVNPEWAVEVALSLVNSNDDLLVILSTHLDLEKVHPRIITASQLSLRENAELTNYCTLFAGCSSGITWMATTDAAKRLPMVQFLVRGIGFRFASVAWDHRYWGLDDAGIIETTNKSVESAVELLSGVMNHGIASMKPRYHQVLRPRFISMLKYTFMFFRKGNFSKSFGIVRQFLRRNYADRPHRKKG